MGSSGKNPGLEFLNKKRPRRISEEPTAHDPKILESLGLTSREAEVLFWIAQGKSNRTISEILGIAPNTVKKHLDRVFEKLGVDNRTAAAKLAIEALG